MKNILAKVFAFVSVFVLLSTQQVSAVLPKDIACANAGGISGTCAYDPTECATTDSGGSSLEEGAASGSGKIIKWDTADKAPYSLEVLIVNILQGLAKSRDVPEADVVTQDHVIALMAWQLAEGGNLHNDNAYNIWNMGILRDHKDLFAGSTGNSDGTGTSYVSLNAAVEGYAISFNGSYQSRIGDALTKQGSTAADVLHAIAFPSAKKGNLPWAWGNFNDSTAAANWSQTVYIKSLQDDLKTAKQTYDDLASTVVGPGEQSSHHVPKSQLKYSGSGGSDASSSDDSADSSGTCACPSGGSGSAGDSSTSGSTDGSKTIVLDPGHAPNSGSRVDVDSKTNIVTTDGENEPEMKQMYEISQGLKKSLEKDGYKVIVTKSSVDDYVNLKKRADIANDANAALGVSIHSDAHVNDVYYPKVGEFRYTSDGKKSAPFSDDKLAATDKKYADKMGAAREKYLGKSVRVGSYGDLFGFRTIKDSPPHMQKGNVLTTQYFAKVPWVYNEGVQDSGNGKMSAAFMKKYEAGLLAGIEDIVPKSGATSSVGGTSSVVPDGNCPTSNSGGDTTDCTTATSTDKILCEAKKFEGIYYEWGGGHQGLKAFKKSCPDLSNPPNNKPTGGPVNGNPGGKSGNPSPCAVDCSGLVSMAVSMAFGGNYSWTVGGAMSGADAKYWKKISLSDAKAGDIVTSTGHVEIVDHVKGNTIYTFGAHSTGTKTGPTTFPSSFISTGGAWRWTGPGTN